MEKDREENSREDDELKKQYVIPLLHRFARLVNFLNYPQHAQLIISNVKNPF